MYALGDRTNMTEFHETLLHSCGHEREYREYLGDGNLNVAMKTLESFSVAGVTEDVPNVMVQIAYHLSLPIDRMKYRSAKVVEGRPKARDHSAQVRELLAEVEKQDDHQERRLWVRARQLAEERTLSFHLTRQVEQFRIQVDEHDRKDCDQSNHDSGGILTGSWCYEMTKNQPDLPPAQSPPQEQPHTKTHTSNHSAQPRAPTKSMA